MSELFDSPTVLNRAATGPVGHDASIAAEQRLKKFCEAVLDLLQSGQANASLLSQVVPSLLKALNDGSRGTVSQLRVEIRTWDAACEPLRQLSDSPFIPFGNEAKVLLSKLERLREQAAGVANALDALQLAMPSAETDESGDSASDAIADRKRGEAKQGPPTPQVSIQDQAAALYHQAEENRRNGKIRAAEDFYTQALALDRGIRPALFHRGRIRVLRGQTAQAIDDLTEALRLSGGEPFAYGWRGNAQAICGRLSEAIEDYSRALELRSDLFIVRYNRAVVLRQSGKLDRSLAEFDQLVRLKPTHGPLHLNRGLIFLERGNLPRAVAEFRAALRHQPDSQEAAQRLRETEVLVEEHRSKRGRKAPLAAPITAPFPSVSIDDRVPPVTPDGERASQATIASSTKRRVECDVPIAAEERSAADSQAACSPIATPFDSIASSSAVKESHDTQTVAPLGSGTIADCSLPFKCPECGNTYTVRWDKLQVGKLLACPYCHRNFTTTPKGEFAEVVKDKNGRWVDGGTQRERERRARSRRSWWLAGSVALVLCGLSVYWSSNTVRSSSPQETPLPDELEPRVELFAHAWLNGDYPLMRRLTDPVQDRQLFGWYRRNPPPVGYDPKTGKEAIQVALEILPSQPPMTALRVRFDGLKSGAGGPAVELQLAWEDRGNRWFFQPDLRLSVAPM